MNNLAVPGDWPSTCDFAAVERLVSRTGGPWTTGRYQRFDLQSHFQPIFSLAHGRIVGFEALLRGLNPAREPVAPHQLLATPRSFAERLLLDRLACAVHLENFQALGRPTDWLFVNVHPEVFIQSPQRGTYLRDLLDARGFAGRRLVVEMLEQSVSDEAALHEAVAFYRSKGCLIALDDFGAGHSNFDRVWSLRPDIVKLDRHMVSQGARDPGVRRVLPGIVSLLHEAGALVVMEGVETRDEAVLAMDCDADFVQGYLFGHPATTVPDPQVSHGTFENLWEEFRAHVRPQMDAYRREIAPYQNALGYAASLMESGMPAHAACNGMLELPDTERCFVLDENGIQLGPNLTPPGRSDRTDGRFNPLGDADGANWSRRPYFRRALEHPGRVQVSRPYLSLAGARPCVTLSMSLRVKGTVRVLCGDVTWDYEHA
ncbi:MAG: EAL domain-containing protein [Burkholderiales bacterium]|nr:EAL domain-containing protein [Burkholderiales bacterium]